MTVVRIDDHQAQARDRLLQQSRGKSNFTALLNSMTAVVQSFETELAYPVLEGRQLNEAEGAQLDGIGSLVGQLRGGALDAEYRLLLQGRIFANASDSTTPTIMALVTALFGAESVQVVSELSPGFSHRQSPGVLGIEIGSPTLPRSLWQQAIAVLKDSLAAAVRLSWVSIFSATDSFALAGPVDGAGLDGQAVKMGMAENIYQDLGA